MPFRPLACLSVISAVLAGAAVSGCADLTRASQLMPGGVDPRSPVAVRTLAATKRDYPYPSFRDVPPRPKDVRNPDQYKAAVVESVQGRRALTTWSAEHPAMVDNTEGFATAARSEIPPEVMTPYDPTVAEPTETYAERLRRLAAAPPPLKNGPAPQPLPPPPPRKP